MKGLRGIKGKPLRAVLRVLGHRKVPEHPVWGAAMRLGYPSTCEPDLPEVITQVETTAAPMADDDALAAIHQDLANQGLLPSQLLVDTGYVSAPKLVESQTDYQVDLVGPTRRRLSLARTSGSRLCCSRLYD